METKRLHRTIVKGLVFSSDKTKILMLKTNRGHWDLPGGHLEFESPEECLRREIKEEINGNIVINKLHSIQTVILDYPHKKERPEIRHYSVLVFKCLILTPDAEIIFNDDEILGFKWFKPELICKDKKIKTPAFNKDIIQDAKNENNIKNINKSFILFNFNCVNNKLWNFFFSASSDDKDPTVL